MSDLYSGTDLFGEFARLQRQMDTFFGRFPSSLRSSRVGAFPQINIGTTDDSMEIVAFVPGLTPSEPINGERQRVVPKRSGEIRTYAQERFSGSFRRAIGLPQHADPDKMQARYANGCLTISAGKRESSKPKAIAVQ